MFIPYALVPPSFAVPRPLLLPGQPGGDRRVALGLGLFVLGPALVGARLRVELLGVLRRDVAALGPRERSRVGAVQQVV